MAIIVLPRCSENVRQSKREKSGTFGRMLHSFSSIKKVRPRFDSAKFSAIEMEETRAYLNICMSLHVFIVQRLQTNRNGGHNVDPS